MPVDRPVLRSRSSRAPADRLGFLAAVLLLAGCADGAGDFNGDGFGDLAIGVPYKNVSEVDDAGAVLVLYGDPDSGRPSAENSQTIQRRPPAEGDADQSDDLPAGTAERFGAALTIGDFNADGLADLAVGVPFQDLEGLTDVGAVTVFYGDPEQGLVTNGGELWYQDKTGIEGTGEDLDLFGFTLAAADFDGDGADDLAAGVPFDNTRSIKNGGAVNVIYGSLTGLDSARSQIFDQLRLGVEVQAGNAQFGKTLITGDFNGDGLADLAVGASEETWERASQAGAVHIIYGDAGGLSAADSQIWRQSDRFIMGGDLRNDGDRFGTALAAGDFDGNGAVDLAIGTPFDNWGEQEDAGTVNVIYGTRRAGLVVDQDQIWHQNVVGTGLTNAARNNYGAALAAGDFNADGYRDLAIGIPGQADGARQRVGAVHVLYGSPKGLSAAAGNQIWQQGKDGLSGDREAGDEFGSILTASDLNSDGADDLVIVARRDRAEATENAGGVYVLYGSDAGLQAGDHQVWHQSSPGLTGEAEAEAFFGAALGVARGGLSNSD